MYCGWRCEDIENAKNRSSTCVVLGDQRGLKKTIYLGWWTGDILSLKNKPSFDNLKCKPDVSTVCSVHSRPSVSFVFRRRHI